MEAIPSPLKYEIERVSNDAQPDTVVIFLVTRA